MLRLETERAAMPVHLPALSFNSPIQEVAGVKLNPGLRRADVDGAPADGIHEPSGVAQNPRPGLIQDPVVVVAVPEAELLVRRVDPRAHRGRCAEVERRARDSSYLARRDQRGI